MTVKVGAVQAEPVWLDLEGGVEKVISLIKQAGADGVNVLGFPEVFIPGYPWSIWTTSVVENVDYVQKYMKNSLRKDSPEMDRIREAVKDAGIFVVLGYSERDGDSLYISQSYINAEGKIVLHRRKIKPTHVERSIWGDGQADSLKNVIDTPYGKVGALNCWEHFQPLLRYYEYSQGSQIHIASWPPVHDDNKKWPYSITNTAELVACQNMAIEGACFVLVSTEIISEASHEITKTGGDDYFKALDHPKGGPRASGGFSMIYAPDGRPLCEPLGKGEEGIVTAVIDLDAINVAKHLLDVVGQYSRPDLLSVLVEPNAASQVTYRK